MHDILSMIYNLVCNNNIHGWIRTTSHDPIPKRIQKIQNDHISSLWVKSIQILTSRCMHCIFIYMSIHPLKESQGEISSEFQLFVGLCVVLYLETASAPHRKLMWALWFAILADLQRLLQPLCRIYSTVASRTFNLELIFDSIWHCVSLHFLDRWVSGVVFQNILISDDRKRYRQVNHN